MTWWQRLTRPRGSLAWDGVVRGTLVLAIIGIVVLLLGSDEASGLVGFTIVTVWVNGPIGMFLPATYEPILMLFGTLYPAVLIASFGMAGTLYIEGLNYYLYQRLLHTRAMRPVRDNAVVRRLTRMFTRAPFFTIWMCSWSPLPYWAVRIMAPLANYPVSRYLFATFLGRFPRLWFFAWLGPALNLSTRTLAIITVASILLFASIFLMKGRKHVEKQDVEKKDVEKTDVE